MLILFSRPALTDDDFSYELSLALVIELLSPSFLFVGLLSAPVISCILLLTDRSLEQSSTVLLLGMQLEFDFISLGVTVPLDALDGSFLEVQKKSFGFYFRSELSFSLELAVFVF